MTHDLIAIAALGIGAAVLAAVLSYFLWEAARYSE
jgi:hypothetical protein